MGTVGVSSPVKTLYIFWGNKKDFLEEEVSVSVMRIFFVGKQALWSQICPGLQLLTLHVSHFFLLDPWGVRS